MAIKKQLPGLTYWNYRVFRHTRKIQSIPGDFTSYGLHETYYDEHGEPTSWTKDPIIAADSVKELLHILTMMKNDIKRHPEVLEYEDQKSD